MEQNKVVHERARFANMSCQRRSIVSSFVSRVLSYNDIVESVNKALFDKEIGVSVVILDPDLFKLSIMQVNHFLLFDLDYQMSP